MQQRMYGSLCHENHGAGCQQFKILYLLSKESWIVIAHSRKISENHGLDDLNCS